MEVPLKPGSPASAIVSNAAIVEEGTKASSPPEARYSYCETSSTFFSEYRPECRLLTHVSGSSG
jgi:hypothetical protein